MELVNPKDGRLTSGVPCIYHTPLGLFFSAANWGMTGDVLRQHYDLFDNGEESWNTPKDLTLLRCSAWPFLRAVEVGYARDQVGRVVWSRVITDIELAK
jgi:hypothetical protein